MNSRLTLSHPLSRSSLEDEIERLIGLLDAIDLDSDLEDDSEDDDADLEDGGDTEPNGDELDPNGDEGDYDGGEADGPGFIVGGGSDGDQRSANLRKVGPVGPQRTHGEMNMVPEIDTRRLPS